ncbi:thiol-disulfide oxidoreductase DCC family protein [Vibrio zhugei]|uniref:Thiol-disulfide oxidoreductase DCC family protein n=1 Tax=Vibrio zhugei TaxID=2479546 RepID=A0ABV7CER7_9VIBR|nr:DUF393 domain-containing protein [Vibrio zhugei]
MSSLIVFYDGTCPLCAKEMDQLRKRDTQQRLHLVDLHSDEFAQFPDIDPVAASEILHAVDQQGRLLLGLDAVHKAWQMVGKGWVYAPLRWPLIRPVADWCYLFFARHRYRISFLFTGTSRCESGQCSINKK